MLNDSQASHPYDPTKLVQLAQSQYPDKPWLAHALTKCTSYKKKSKAYIYFVASDRPNQSGSAWQFVQNIELNHPTEGTLILDILTNQRIGGIEFLDKY